MNRRDFLRTGTAGTGALALTGRLPAPSLAATTASATPAAAGAAAATPTTASVASPVFAGVQVMPTDPRYATVVRGFNLRWVGHPAYVSVCGDTSQIVAAVQSALDSGRRITVRGGGHCYEDFVSNNEGGVIIDLSPMNAVWRDPDTGWFGIEGGATLWDVYRQLYVQYGVTIPGGSCYSVGVGGHVVGGGYGLLARLHGLTVDYLHAVEVVIVTAARRAEVITVSRDATDPAEQDLMWGHLGGGGGNFGIITKYWFKDPPAAPDQVLVLSHAFDWSTFDRAAFGRLLSNYGQFLAANSAVDSPYKGLFTLLHLTQKAAGQIVLTAQYVGTEPARLTEFVTAVENGLPRPQAALIAPGEHRPVSTTDIRQLPWLFATQTLNGSGPNRRGKYKSAYMLATFPDTQIDAMWQYLTNPDHPNSQALLQIDSYGCQVNAVAPAATAVPQRSSIMKLQYQTYWTDPADDAINLDWIRKFYTAMYGPRGPVPDKTVDGCYVNYPDVDLTDWQTLYYKDNYPRLQAVKQRWDPHNIFNHKQSIELPRP